MTKTLLEVKGLKKYFPITKGLFRKTVGFIKAVDDIDFKIKQGEVLGLVGESGSGKSTAARSCIRLIEPTGGAVNFKGKDFLSLNSEQLKLIRRDIQIVFQDPFSSLNPRKTIGDSIGEALLYHNLVDNKEQEIEKVRDILDKIGISKEAFNRYPHQFSGGQQQRICVGRAIAMNPSLIICDEAVSALDVSVQAQILNLLIELKNNMNLSYLFISHDLSVIRHISDRVAVMYQGKIVESGLADDIFSNPKHPYTIKLLSAIPINHPRKR